MILECPYCRANVDGKMVGSHESYDPNEDPAPFRVSLLECPSCKNSLVGGQELEGEVELGNYWSTPIRLWPSPKRNLSWEIPSIVRVSLEEANRCFHASAYMACAVMCGRALEGVCRHFNTKSQYIGGGLKELLEREIVDKRFFQWGQELQEHRNKAAHATDEKFTKKDAEDLLNFVTAMAEYIFVLTEQFELFIKRKNSKIKKKQVNTKMKADE